jgi:hypothetical protein
MERELNVRSAAITTTGSAGSATGSGTVSCIPGELAFVKLDYHASAPGGTTDVTLTQTAEPTAILTVTDSATDQINCPSLTRVTTANAAIANSSAPLHIHGPVSVAVAGCNALTAAVTVYVGTWS